MINTEKIRSAYKSYMKAEKALQESDEMKQLEITRDFYHQVQKEERIEYLKDEQKACDEAGKLVEAIPEWKACKAAGNFDGCWANGPPDDDLQEKLENTPEYKAYKAAIDSFYLKQDEYVKARVSLEKLIKIEIYGG